MLPVCTVLNVFSHQVAVHANETHGKSVAYESFLHLDSLSDDLMHYFFAQVLHWRGRRRGRRSVQNVMSEDDLFSFDVNVQVAQG